MISKDRFSFLLSSLQPLDFSHILCQIVSSVCEEGNCIQGEGKESFSRSLTLRNKRKSLLKRFLFERESQKAILWFFKVPSLLFELTFIRMNEHISLPSPKKCDKRRGVSRGGSGSRKRNGKRKRSKKE